MNEFRLSEYGKVFRIAEQPNDDYYQFIAPEQESVLGYIVDGKVLVLLIASDEHSILKSKIYLKGNGN